MIPIMTTVAELIQSIERRIQELRGEISRFEEARRALTNGSAASKSQTDQGKGVGRRKTLKKPKVVKKEVMLAAQLERILGESEGLGTADIAAQGNADQNQVLTLLKELEATGKVRRTGERRGTRWHLLTDEDRVAAPAEELASRSSTD